MAKQVCNTGFDFHAIQYSVLLQFSFNRVFELINLNVYVPKRPLLAVAPPLLTHFLTYRTHAHTHHSSNMTYKLMVINLLVMHENMIKMQ